MVQSPHPPSNDLSTSRNIIQQQTPSNQYPVRFNQELLQNFGINIPPPRQSETQLSTSLIPIPSSLSNNLTMNNIHHMNQPSITPTIIGTYPIRQSSLHNTYIPSHSHMGKVNQQIRASNGMPPNVLHHPTMIQTQQMMKPRMIHPNTYELSSQVIRPQQSTNIYDSNIIHQSNIQKFHHVSSDNNNLKSLLQMNSQMTLESQKISNSNEQTQITIPTEKIPKPRRKRKANDTSASLEEDAPTKSRKRKSMFIFSIRNKFRPL